MAGVAVIAAACRCRGAGVPIDGNLVLTGLGAFGFAEAALVLTAATTLVLALQVGGGLRAAAAAARVGAAGRRRAWAAVIVGYRMFDRPEFDPGDRRGKPYDLATGSSSRSAGRR